MSRSLNGNLMGAAAARQSAENREELLGWQLDHKAQVEKEIERNKKRFDRVVKLIIEQYPDRATFEKWVDETNIISNDPIKWTGAEFENFLYSLKGHLIYLREYNQGDEKSKETEYKKLRKYLPNDVIVRKDTPPGEDGFYSCYCIYDETGTLFQREITGKLNKDAYMFNLGYIYGGHAGGGDYLYYRIGWKRHRLTMYERFLEHFVNTRQPEETPLF